MLGAGHDLLNRSHSQEGISYKLAPATGPCHLHLYGLIHVLLQLLIFNTPERSSGWRAEMRNSVLEGKTGRTGLQIVRYSQEPILWAQFLYLLISRKALHGDICSSWLAKTCKKKKKSAWLHVLPLHQNSIYPGIPPYFFGAVSQSSLICCLLGYSPHFAPHKIWLITLKLCIFF